MKNYKNCINLSNIYCLLIIISFLLSCFNINPFNANGYQFHDSNATIPGYYKLIRYIWLYLIPLGAVLLVVFSFLKINIVKIAMFFGFLIWITFITILLWDNFNTLNNSNQNNFSFELFTQLSLESIIKLLAGFLLMFIGLTGNTPWIHAVETAPNTIEAQNYSEVELMDQLNALITRFQQQQISITDFEEQRNRILYDLESNDFNNKQQFTSNKSPKLTLDKILPIILVVLLILPMVLGVAYKTISHKSAEEEANQPLFDTANSNAEKINTASNTTAGEQLNDIDGDYPELSERIISPSELSGYTKDQLRIMRNEIFARHGYIFNSQDLSSYFERKSWYHPRYTNVFNMLSSIEKANVNTITNEENNSGNEENNSNVSYSNAENPSNDLDPKEVVKTFFDDVGENQNLDEAWSLTNSPYYNKLGRDWFNRSYGLVLASENFSILNVSYPDDINAKVEISYYGRTAQTSKYYHQLVTLKYNSNGWKIYRIGNY